MSKFLDENGLSHLISKLINTFVKQADGKGLSSNDFTDTEKTKLSELKNYDDTSIRALITAINEKIPTEASKTNQLADKNFVNSSIATNTATFRGTYESVNDLPTESSVDGLKVNDYAFVITTNNGNPEYSRYKYTVSGTTKQWSYEYTLNNSSFTEDQWKAIQSGITSALVGQITTNKNSIITLNSTKANASDVEGLSNSIVTINGDIQTLNANKADKSTVTSLSSRVGTNETDISNLKKDKANSADLSKVATSGSYSDLTNKPTIPTVDSALSSTSTNPVQNKVINTALGNKLDKSSYKVDTTLNNSSSNPIANSTVTTALLGKASTGSVPTSASFTLNGSRLYLTLKNSSGEAITEPNVSLSSLVAEAMTNDEIDDVFEDA